MGKDTETRTFKLGEVVRAAGKAPKIRGYALVFNSPSQDLGGFIEVIAPGAIKEISPDLRSYFNHDPNHVLGRVSNSTLSVEADETGLLYEVTPPDTTWAADLVKQIERGDITDASFRFSTIEDKWETPTDEKPVRTLLQIAVHELGPVSEGAYPEASAAVRSLEKWKESGANKEESEKPDSESQYFDHNRFRAQWLKDLGERLEKVKV